MLTKNQKELEERFRAKMLEEAAQSNGVFIAHSYPKTPILTNEQVGQIELGQWGLIPSWAKDLNMRSYTLNARIETLSEKPSFKASVGNRCLVLADSFFEWKWLDAKGKHKVKYRIHLPDDQAYAYAGLFNDWVDDQTGEIIRSYTVITTAANALMSEIHNTKKRMPVILKREDEQSWLEGVDYKAFAFPYEVDLIADVVGGGASAQVSMF